MTNVLNADELLYLSMLNGADEVFGIPDVFFGKTEDEIKTYIEEISGRCAHKKLYVTDFEGKIKLSEDLDNTIGVVSAPDTVTEAILRNTKSNQQRYLIYTKDKSKAVLYESGGEYFIIGESKISEIHTGLRVLFADSCLIKSETSAFMVRQDEVNDIKTGNKTKKSIMRALMREKGVDETTALLISEGMAGNAGYFSATTVSCIDNSVETVHFIADSGIVFQIAADTKHNLNFTVADTETARQTALSFFGGDMHV